MRYQNYGSDSKWQNPTADAFLVEIFVHVTIKLNGATKDLNIVIIFPLQFWIIYALETKVFIWHIFKIMRSANI
jgi:hypothetical protein